jgi:dUTP pyrophosphatase
MKVKIRRIDKSLPLPEYKTEGAVALDCSAREKTIIPSKQVGFVPLNFALHPPEGHFVLMAARSSLPKRGLMLANGVGVFDEDFSGNDDEYKAILYNFTDSDVVVEKGDRITQIMFLSLEKIEWKEVEDLGNPTRGGIGSTGT